jgi:hypothetical protein
MEQNLCLTFHWIGGRGLASLRCRSILGLRRIRLRGRIRGDLLGRGRRLDRMGLRNQLALCRWSSFCDRNLRDWSFHSGGFYSGASATGAAATGAAAAANFSFSTA